MNRLDDEFSSMLELLAAGPVANVPREELEKTQVLSWQAVWREDVA
jgi:hypothetical protein